MGGGLCNRETCVELGRNSVLDGGGASLSRGRSFVSLAFGFGFRKAPTISRLIAIARICLAAEEAFAVPRLQMLDGC